MAPPPRIVSTTLACSLLVLAACSDSREPTQPSTEPNPEASQAVAQTDLTEAGALAKGIPGFGGFFVDAMGVPTLRLTNPAGRAEAQRVMQPLLRSLDGSQQLRVISADYTAQQLDAWVERASAQVLRIPKVVFLDNSEEEGRVVVGVESRAAEGAVRAAMERLGIPRKGVTVTEVGPVTTALTLQQRVRPVIGGVQIYFAVSSSSAFLCTLGFNALNAGDARFSFITNSHCTRNRGNVAPATLYHQPSPGAGSFIGTEVEDPPFFTGGVCPAGRRCRRSDAARAVYARGVTFLRGRLARTTGFGSITIAGNWTVVGEESPVVGRTLNKVGRTTGWSAGRVTHTCVTVNVSGSVITMICQDIVRANVGAGDSGSPVFRRISPSSQSVVLNGILWGGTTISGFTHFVFSRISLIEAELGPLTTS
jgi:hypothetical protein